MNTNIVCFLNDVNIGGRWVKQATKLVVPFIKLYNKLNFAISIGKSKCMTILFYSVMSVFIGDELVVCFSTYGQ